MNFQDVSHIRIPDGDVRMIHDSDNRLLWGAVGYNVLFSGDTFQQTYTGKNLFNENEPKSTYYIDRNGNEEDTGRYDYINIEYSVSGGEDMTVSFASKVGVAYVRIAQFRGDGTFIQRSLVSTSPTTVTLSSDARKIILSVNQSNTLYFTGLQVEYGSTASAYEPFVGGQPSPNPDYPQLIQTVTGVQTISINGTNYPLDLGDIELFGLGDDGNGNPLYKDRIWKDGDSWKVHKDIASTRLTSSYDWLTDHVSDQNRLYINSENLAGAGVRPSSNMQIGQILSTHFSPISITNLLAGDGGIGISQTGFISIRDNEQTTANGFKDWLDNNNIYAYYALATPTDTIITDQTLIAQLEAIYNLVRRYGYNFVVSASGNNLPIIIDRTLL